MAKNAESQSVRGRLVEAVRLDLVGPDNDHPFAHELLPESPTRWYLTGFLIPRDAPEEQRAGPEGDEQLDAGGDVEADEGAPPDRAAAGKSYLPSSLGVSVLVAPGVEVLDSRVLWGDYEFEGAAEASPVPEDAAPVPVDPQPAGAGGPATRPLRGHRRLPREETVALALPAADAPPLWRDVPSSRGLTLVVTCRALPPGPSWRAR